MARFDDNFWGDKHHGYDVLYQNMKHGEQSSKDWTDFLRQYAAVEEQYCKALTRLSKSAGTYLVVGSFASVWPIVKASFERLALAHQDMSRQWQDMIKEMVKYCDGQFKKHRAIKDAQTATVDVVQTMQHVTGALQKSKEVYHSKFAEYCKARKENASLKKTEKIDSDFKKTAEEYRATVAKYNATREDFQSKLVDSCKVFQEQEEAHLTQMLNYLKMFAAAHEEKHIEIGEMYYEFHNNIAQLSTLKLLQDFVDLKRTGTERPPTADFEEVDMSLLPKSQVPEDADGGEKKKDDSSNQSTSGANTMHIIIPGILKKRSRVKKQKNAQRGSAANGSKDADCKDSDSLDTQSKTSLPEVDDDGYTIRKEEPHKEEDSWDSDSDSCSDSERKQKIKVEIKPLERSELSHPAAQEYRLPLKLSSTQLASAGTAHERASRSKLGDSSESSGATSAWDLMGLDLLGTSVPATPDSEHLSSTSSGNGVLGSVPPPGSADSSSTEDREVERLWQPSAEKKQAPHVEPAPVVPGLPRPPSRREITGAIGRHSAVAGGRSSPLQKAADLLGSSAAAGAVATPFSSSRGPSPMCGAGPAESMPIAIALTEVVDAYLRSALGSQKATVRVTGDIMVSFPVAVVKLLIENPVPPALVFKLVNVNKLDQWQVNEQLILSTAERDGDIATYSFSMPALLDYLRNKQVENRMAPYFNVDIAKYAVKSGDADSLPLRVRALWRCEPTRTDFNLDYAYNAGGLVKPLPLSNVSFLVPVDGDVTGMQAVPAGLWSHEHKKCLWKLDELQAGSNSAGAVRARFELASGPTSPASTAVQFVCDGTTISGLDFELVGSSYRLSLVKRRMCTGKFLVDSEVRQATDIRYV